MSGSVAPMRGTIKQTLISSGLYKPARALYRAFSPSQRRDFQQHRALLSAFIRPEDLVFDVGANIGTRSEIMLSLGANVVAFEPQPNCAREVRARGKNGRLIVVEKAVGSSIGHADLHLKEGSVQASLLSDWQGGPDTGMLRVPVTTLDEEIKRFGRPTFCKIDVEGYEGEVIAGLSMPINAMSFEYHCNEAGTEKLRKIFDKLDELGTYETNLIGEENNTWLLPRWLPAAELIGSFPTVAGPHYWGDCFVRLVD
jgi:FkbM family methyltransferase